MRMGEVFYVSHLRQNAFSWIVRSGNAFGDAGCTALASALRTNTTLSALYCSYAGIGEAGGLQLAAALESNVSHQLRVLQLNESDVSEATLRRIADCLRAS